MLTLQETKDFLRVDIDDEDALIQSLITSAVDYIETATGLTAEEQDAEPICKMAQFNLVMAWYQRDGYGGELEKVITSLLKSAKVKKIFKDERKARAARQNGATAV